MVLISCVGAQGRVRSQHALLGRLVAELAVVTAGPQLLQAIADRVALA
jgi:hypothetical protein